MKRQEKFIRKKGIRQVSFPGMALFLLLLLSACTGALQSTETKASRGAEGSRAESGGASGEKTLYRIAVDRDAPPFSMRSGEEYTGLDIDLMDAVARVEGITVEYRPMDFSGMIPSVITGTSDAAMGGMRITVERQEKLDFSLPYLRASLAFGMQREREITALSDLTDQVVAVREGSVSADLLERERARYRYSILTVQSTEDLYGAVTGEQALACLTDASGLYYEALVHPDSALKLSILPESEAAVALAVNHGQNRQLLLLFNEGLEKLRERGEYQEILARYGMQEASAGG